MTPGAGQRRRARIVVVVGFQSLALLQDFLGVLKVFVIVSTVLKQCPFDLKTSLNVHRNDFFFK